jgi:hypothetical protein
MNYHTTVYSKSAQAYREAQEFETFRARLKQNVKQESLKQWKEPKNLKQD